MNINIKIKNAEEFQKLLENASSLLKELEDTLQQINEFEFEVENK